MGGVSEVIFVTVVDRVEVNFKCGGWTGIKEVDGLRKKWG